MDTHESSPHSNKRKHGELSNFDADHPDAGCSNLNNKKSTNTSSGIHCGLPGNEYQILVTMYLLLRVYNKCRLNCFELRMERTDAGKFDDIWIKVADEELFVQVKHQAAKSNITKGMLLPGTGKGREEGAFSLYKYCVSFSKLDKCCVLLTNQTISEKVSTMLEPIKGRSLFTKLLGKSGQHYRLRNDSSVIGDLSKEKSINAFCKMFILSVNHDDADKLRSLIQDEIEELEDETAEILREDAEHVFNRLRGRLVNWVCNKESRITSISNPWIIRFINKINDDYKCISNAYYHEFIDRMEMHPNVIIKQERMKVLQDYLHEQRVILLKFVNTYFLRLVQSYQLIKNKLFTFLLFSRLNNTATRTKFEHALKSRKSKQSDLLIVVDDVDDECSVMDWILKVPIAATKLIVISRKAAELKQRCEQQNIPAAIEIEQITLADLGEESVAGFLERKIFFQGSEIELGKMPELSTLAQQIGETLLEQLIRGEIIEIGVPLPDVTSCCSLYVPRSFTTTYYFFDVDEFRSVKKFCFNSRSLKVGYNEEKNDETNEFDIDKFHIDSLTVYILKKCSQDYKDLRQMNTFLGFLRNRQIFDSIGSGCLEQNIFQHSFDGFPEKVKILSGEIGTGKSTTWLQLANLLKKADTAMWVVFIKLSDGAVQTQLNAKLNSKLTEEFVITLLEQAVSSNSWEAEYFRKCLKNTPSKVSVFLDGFDEICPSYKTIVIEIIDRLLRMSVQSIFVSTRMYMENELQREFLTTAYHLSPLTEEEQISLIKHFWSEQGHLEEYSEYIVRRMVQKLESLISVYEFHFPGTNIGAPLAIKMIANLSPQQVEDFLKDHYTIYDLFDDFVQQIFKRFCIEKRKIQTALNSNMIEELEMKQSFHYKLNLFAMKWLYTPEDLNRFLTAKERKELQELSGKSIEETTVRELILYPPRFIHRSYAEYFVASFIYEKFTNFDDVNYFWVTFGRVLNQDGKDLVRIFFVYKLERDGCMNVESSKVVELLNLISTDPASFVCKQKLPNCFRALLNSSNQYSLLIDAVTQYNRLEMVKILVEHGYDQYDLLCKAILHDRLKLVQYLVGGAQSLNRRDSEGLTLLHKAARAGNIKIAIELIREGADLNVQDNSGHTPILMANKHRQFYMASYLREQSSRDVTENLESFIPYDGLTTDIRDICLLLFLRFIIYKQSTSFKIIEHKDDYKLLKIDENFIILAKESNLRKCVEVFISNPESLESECYVVTDEHFMGGTQAAETPMEKFFRTAFLYPVETPIISILKDDYQTNIAQFITQSKSINDSSALKFAGQLKLMKLRCNRLLFLENLLHSLKNTSPFRCPEYTLARLQHKLLAEFKEATEWNRNMANNYLEALNREAYELHSCESKLKYRNFMFKEPVSSIPGLDFFLHSSPQLKPWIVNNTIEAAKIVQHLGARIDDHIPGWLFQEGLLKPDSKLVFVHNLDCQSDSAKICDRCNHIHELCCKFALKNAQLKFIVSLKHHSQCTETNLDTLDDNFIDEILHYPVTFQANTITLGMLTESLFKNCIFSGALEYIALNLPIFLGRQHPLYYHSWDYRITRSDLNEDASSTTFHKSLRKLLQENIAFVSTDDVLSIMACGECALPVELPSPAAVSFLACESSWCRKDKWVIAFDGFLHISEAGDTIQNLITTYRSIDSEILSKSCLEFCLRTSPNDVILIIDARDAILDQYFKKTLKLISDTGISVVVHIKAAQREQAATLNIRLYQLEKVIRSFSFDKTLPHDARICKHMENGCRNGKGTYA